MIESDTIKLLRECDSGAKMGIASLDDVSHRARKKELGQILAESKKDHARLSDEIRKSLHRFGDEGKNPNPMVKAMSKMKTNMKLMVNGTDRTVASLMTDGCNMGIKSLSTYLNKYKAADEDSKEIAKKLISLEEDLAKNMRTYL